MLVPIVATLLGCARGERVDRQAPPTTSPATALRQIRVLSVEPEEGRAPEPCPAIAGLGLALTVGGLDLGENPSLQVAVGCEAGDVPGSVAVHAAANLTVAPAGAPEESFEGAAIETCTACGAGTAGPTLLLATGRAVRSALDVAVAQRRLGAASDEEVAALLKDPRAVSRQVVLTALDEAGDRRLKVAVPSLLKVLDSDDPDLVLRAEGALGQIGDPAAIKALGRLALSPAPEVPHVALRAIADIGGAEARRALELVAGQTGDPVIAREARDLLREMDEGRRE